jgi:hypothetical protein
MALFPPDPVKKRIASDPTDSHVSIRLYLARRIIRRPSLFAILPLTARIGVPLAAAAAPDALPLRRRYSSVIAAAAAGGTPALPCSAPAARAAAAAARFSFRRAIAPAPVRLRFVIPSPLLPRAAAFRPQNPTRATAPHARANAGLGLGVLAPTLFGGGITGTGVGHSLVCSSSSGSSQQQPAAASSARFSD